MTPLDETINLWVQSLRTIAQTGLAFSPSVFDRERYEEMLQLAAEMAATDAALSTDVCLSGALVESWRAQVRRGVPGYITPKVGVGALVFDAHDRLLLIERPSRTWLFPTGFADIGYSPAQVVVKEVREETGLAVTPLRLVAVYDIRRLLEEDLDLQIYSLVFYCRLDGGVLRPRPHEALDAGFFARENLPSPLARENLNWVDHAWAAHRGRLTSPYFDPGAG